MERIYTAIIAPVRMERMTGTQAEIEAALERHPDASEILIFNGPPLDVSLRRGVVLTIAGKGATKAAASTPRTPSPPKHPCSIESCGKKRRRSTFRVGGSGDLCSEHYDAAVARQKQEAARDMAADMHGGADD